MLYEPFTPAGQIEVSYLWLANIQMDTSDESVAAI